MTRIVVADDHAFIRHGVRALLERETDFGVVGEAGDGLSTVELIESLQPDVLVLDIVIPSLSGLEVIRRVRHLSKSTEIVVLSMYDYESYVLESLWVGAKAYVLKRSSSEELVHAIRAVVGGGYYLDTSLSGRAIEAYIEKARNSTVDLYETLTSREREILHLAAEGYTCARMAARLFISQRTAELHRSHVMHKLGLRSQTDLVRYALRRGILPVDDPS